MKAATPSPRGLGKRSEGDSRACRPHRPLAKSFGVARVPAAEHMANYQAARRSWARERAAQRRALRRRRNQRNDPGDRLQRNEEVLMLSKPSLRGAAAKYQIACSRILSEFRCEPVPYPDFRFQRFSFQSFSLSPVAHPAMIPVRNSRRCCRSARSCFNCRSTRDRRASDGPVRAKFHESSRLASTRLNSRARTDRVNSLRTERICDSVVLAPGAFDKSLSASKSSIRATSPAAYASWTSCQSEETVASPSARQSGCNRRTSRR